MWAVVKEIICWNCKGIDHPKSKCLSARRERSYQQVITLLSFHTDSAEASMSSATQNILHPGPVPPTAVPAGPNVLFASDIRATLLHSPCRCRVDLEGAASRWASSQRSGSCCQSSEFIGRYRRPTAGAMALAESSRVRSGSAARATAVHAWCPRVPEERLERAESRLRGWDRRTADQGHRV